MNKLFVYIAIVFCLPSYASKPLHPITNTNPIGAYLAACSEPGHMATIDYLENHPVHGKIFTSQKNRDYMLRHAAHNGVCEVVVHLLQRGANPNAKTALGNTALHEAIHQGDETIIEWLRIYGANPQIRHSDYGTIADEMPGTYRNPLELAQLLSKITLSQTATYSRIIALLQRPASDFANRRRVALN